MMVMRSRTNTLCFTACLAVLLISQIDSCFAQTCTNGALRCWLNSLVIHVPDQSLSGVTLSDITISGIDVATFSSSLPSDDEIQIGLNDVAAEAYAYAVL